METSRYFFPYCCSKKTQKNKKNKNPTAVLSLQGRWVFDILSISTAKLQEDKEKAFLGVLSTLCWRKMPFAPLFPVHLQGWMGTICPSLSHLLRSAQASEYHLWEAWRHCWSRGNCSELFTAGNDHSSTAILLRYSASYPGLRQMSSTKGMECLDVAKPPYQIPAKILRFLQDKHF